VRRDYESLYSLGVALTAYAAAEAVHGSGFLAVFTAGLTIVSLDVELCDCFLDYGGATAEMALLFTFVLFGSSLIWSGLTVITGSTLLFALIVLLVRPPVFLLSLAWSGVDRADRLMIAWFGPRGLSSLLLVLLPVFAGLPGSAQLFALCCLVVLLSVVVHGGSPMLLGRRTQRRAQAEDTVSAPSAAIQTAAPTAVAAEAETRSPPDGRRLSDPPHAIPTPPMRSEVAAPATTLNPDSRPTASDSERVLSDPIRISVSELQQLWARGAPLYVLDVRRERAYAPSPSQARGAVRLSPDERIADQATALGLPREAWLVAYCA
jgi:hypothetical protein